MDLTREQILNEPSGKQMDAWINEYIFGRIPCDQWHQEYGGWGLAVLGEKIWQSSCKHDNCYNIKDPPHYSSAIGVTWEIVDQLIGEDGTNQDFFLECWSDGEWFVAFHALGVREGTPRAHCDGKKTGHPSAPLAICRAALLLKLDDEIYDKLYG